jgi:hypothetical protein
LRDAREDERAPADEIHQIEAAWKKFAPRQGLKRELQDGEPAWHEIAALNTLAGGNPRTLNALYRVLESRMGDDVLAQLNAMLDTFTSAYQDWTNELPAQCKAVFDTLALNWDPMTAAMLGEATGLETIAVSSQAAGALRIAIRRVDRRGGDDCQTLPG